MAENNILADALRNILKEDRTLLSRSVELNEKIDAAENLGSVFLARQALQDALASTNVGELLYVADRGTKEQRDQALEDARAALRDAGIEEEDAETTLKTIASALDWDKAPAPQPAKKEEAAEDELPVWMQHPAEAASEDDAEAEKARRKAEKEAEMKRIAEERAARKEEKREQRRLEREAKKALRQKAEEERQRAEAEQKPVGTPPATWTCACGQQNTGNFCTACGRSRETAEEERTNAKMRGGQAERIELRDTPQDSAWTGQQTERPVGGGSKFGCVGCAGWAFLFLVVICIAFGLWTKSEDSSGATNSAWTSTSSSGAAKAKREMKSDLSLGGLDLDMSIDDVRKALGKENTSEQRGKFNFLLYDNVEVGTYENSVRALVSNGPSAQTKRGIHEGSSLADVQNAYGVDAMVSDYDGLTLYEYSFKSMNGNDGLLRFAIQSDQTVKYISIRIPEDEKPAAKADSKLDPNEAAQALNDYYQGITHHNGRNSYSILSADMQQHMGTYDQFISGYQTTLSHNLSDLTLVSQEGTQVTISYTLTARDRTNTSRVKVQTFHCEATLSKATGSWHIVNMSAKKQSERME